MRRSKSHHDTSNVLHRPICNSVSSSTIDDRNLVHQGYTTLYFNEFQHEDAAIGTVHGNSDWSVTLSLPFNICNVWHWWPSLLFLREIESEQVLNMVVIMGKLFWAYWRQVSCIYTSVCKSKIFLNINSTPGQSCQNISKYIWTPYVSHLQWSC